MFKGQRVELKPIETAYIDDIMKGWNNPELKQYLNGAVPHPRSYEVNWLQRAEDDMANMRGFVFAIERTDNGKFIGTIGVHSINWISRSATIGIAIYYEEDQGKGFGTEALKILIDFAWRDLNLRRLDLTVYEFNERAIRTYEKLGFKKFGTAHQKMFIRGIYCDVHYMELFREQK